MEGGLKNDTAARIADHMANMYEREMERALEEASRWLVRDLSDRIHYLEVCDSSHLEWAVGRLNQVLEVARDNGITVELVELGEQHTVAENIRSLRLRGYEDAIRGLVIEFLRKKGFDTRNFASSTPAS